MKYLQRNSNFRDATSTATLYKPKMLNAFSSKLKVLNFRYEVSVSSTEPILNKHPTVQNLCILAVNNNHSEKKFTVFTARKNGSMMAVHDRMTFILNKNLFSYLKSVTPESRSPCCRRHSFFRYATFGRTVLA